MQEERIYGTEENPYTSYMSGSLCDLYEKMFLKSRQEKREKEKKLKGK